MQRGGAEFDDGRRAAAGLARHLGAGGSLRPQPTALRLGPGESEYAQLAADGFRFHGLDAVAYRRTSFIALGSVPLLAASVGGSALWNARQRRRAEAEARAQWRPMGTVAVAVTSQRVMVGHEMRWDSVWFAQIAQVVPRVDDFALDVIFEGAPPYRFTGPSVPFLSVLLVHLCYGEILALDGPPPPATPPPALPA